MVNSVVNLFLQANQLANAMVDWLIRLTTDWHHTGGNSRPANTLVWAPMLAAISTCVSSQIEFNNLGNIRPDRMLKQAYQATGCTCCCMDVALVLLVHS